MVVAVGTQFDVRRDTDQVIVDVVEGRVVVLPRSPAFPIALLHALRPRLAAVSVGAGEQTSVDGWVGSLHSALGIIAVPEGDRIVLRRAQ